MYDLTHLKAVVFDFDGTLAETNIDFAEMRRRIYALVQQWGLWDEGMGENRYVLEVIDAAAAKLTDEARGTRGAGVSPAAGETPAPRVRRAEFEREAARVLVEVEMETCATAAPYAGVPEALARLRQAGLKIGIVTRNCRECVAGLLARHPLPHDVLLTRDDVAPVKPDPAHLRAALAQLGVAPAEALMVGDHRSDIECALAAGCRGVGVHLTGSDSAHFAELGALASYPDVPAFVDDLLNHA